VCDPAQADKHNASCGADVEGMSDESKVMSDESKGMSDALEK
jgi:hypothetical protein